ncbi:FAD-binding oxidoreductase [Pseudooceanicola sediminis]|uniref:FAD-binding oxidoreductase n=1 Tax=Pseudooceanicola sediminis TaxID=2211117 RepID=A0A399J3S7_9RHOB|nr:FAD-binding oxidoreductase [Pseudooceanicola sediminis]KAA2311516.1 FAD-binding oxidoreductase [Puniceibacterium sp. HSS470]RII40043.1 FAD-binding oxidoreductase [Pseudooceanicola sediminis]|tara:strand:- start:112007 stop:113419 length:1413 start_codon:yes stop_codon:yes gene_type:complete
MPHLNDVDDSFVATLHDLLPEAAFRDPAAYVEEPRGSWRGKAGVVVAPGSTAEVAAVMQAANAARIAVVPYGGGTGLVGGQILQDGPLPLILSMERMTKIRHIDAFENVLIAEAGAIVETLHQAAEEIDRLFPLSFAAQGSARIGGSLGTNAGGLNVLRYGNTRDLCLGLEVVMADGRVMNTLTRLRKDNTGYDLRNLMIGSEGTLGVITAAALKLFPRPAARATALMVVPSPQAALELLAMTRDRAGENISAFELISGMGLEFLARELPDLRRPFDPAPDWMVLTELGLARGGQPEAMLEAIFEQAFEAGLVSDGIVAQNAAQAAELWNVRETIPEANRLTGAIASHDISIPITSLPAFIEEGRAKLAEMGPYRLNCFGHLGDGNMHYNVFPPEGESKADYAAQKAPVMKMIHDLVAAYDGSISAEHGIGRLKAADLARYGDPVKLELMRGIKDLFDPNGILNPGAVLL